MIRRSLALIVCTLILPACQGTPPTTTTAPPPPVTASVPATSVAPSTAAPTTPAPATSAPATSAPATSAPTTPPAPTSSAPAQPASACLANYGACFTSTAGLKPITTKVGEGDGKVEEIEFRRADGAAIARIKGTTATGMATVCQRDTYEIVRTVRTALVSNVEGRPIWAVQFLHQVGPDQWIPSSALTTGEEYATPGVLVPCNPARAKLAAGNVLGSVVRADETVAYPRERALAALDESEHQQAFAILASARPA